MTKKFDKIINKKISNTEVKPSTSLWDKIEAELPEEKENKTFFLLPFIASPLFKNAIAASVIFLLGGLSAFYFINPQTNTYSNQTEETNSTTTNTKISKTVTAQTDEIVSETNTKENKSNKINSKTSNKTKLASNTLAKISKQAKASFNPKVSSIKNINQNQNMSAQDYTWVYNKKTGYYSVFLKEKLEDLSSTLNDDLLADTKKQKSFSEASFMSIIEKKQEEEKEKAEILETNEEDPTLELFNSKSNKINYKGLWLGPNVAYEALFLTKEVYHGGSFGIDLGYDFGGSWGIQSGLKYAINSKTINITDKDGTETSYKSEFNSIHVPLYLRYKFTKLTHSYAKPLSLNLVGGLDYAYANVKNLHKLGLNLGLEYDVFTQADLMLTLGLRGGMYNNLNLYKLDLPEQINRYNYSLNAYVSVRFIDWAKKEN